MNKYGQKPYTYLLICTSTNQYYYGVRWANRLPAQHDFWTVYFTSCKRVHKLIEVHGKDAFKFEIRREFDCKESALQWEEKVLRRLKVLNDPLSLNRNIRGVTFVNDGPVTDVTRAKMAEAKRNRVVKPETCVKISQLKQGNIPWNKGLKGVFKHKDQTVELIRQASLNQEWTEERCNNISKAKKGKPSPLKGRKCPPKKESTRDKLRVIRTGMKVWNNGNINKMSKECPGPEWHLGKLKIKRQKFL